MLKKLLLVLISLPVVCQAEPITEAKLFEMIESGVDTDLIVSIVQRDCVAFSVDADKLIFFSGKVDKQIIEAILSCSEENVGSTTSPHLDGQESRAQGSESETEEHGMRLPASFAVQVLVPREYNGKEVGEGQLTLYPDHITLELFKDTIRGNRVILGSISGSFKSPDLEVRTGKGYALCAADLHPLNHFAMVVELKTAAANFDVYEKIKSKNRGSGQLNDPGIMTALYIEGSAEIERQKIGNPRFVPENRVATYALTRHIISIAKRYQESIDLDRSLIIDIARKNDIE